MKQTTRLVLFALFSSFIMLQAGISYAEDEILSLEGARIRGNQELPNVLYLIPWKPPKVYSLEAPENNLAANRPFNALERSSFIRLVNYHEAFKRNLAKINETVIQSK